MRTFYLSLLVISLIFSFSCNNEQKEAKTDSKDQENVEREISFMVNDRPVYKDQLSSNNMEISIQDEIIYETALIDGIDKDPEIIKKLELYKRNFIVGTLKGKIIKEYMKNIDINDEDVKKYYNDNIIKYTYLDIKKVSVTDKDIADNIYDELSKGTDLQKIITDYKDKDIIVIASNITNSKKYTKIFDKSEIGQITEPILQQGRYAIYRIDNIEKADFNRLQKVIKFSLTNHLRSKSIEEYVEKAKKEHNITITEAGNK